jgi:hypothetical protein
MSLALVVSASLQFFDSLEKLENSQLSQTAAFTTSTVVGQNVFTK